MTTLGLSTPYIGLSLINFHLAALFKILLSTLKMYWMVLVEVSFSDSTIHIRFTSILGTPNNLNDLYTTLDEIKPSHLRISYAFAYLLIKDIRIMTLAEIENTILDKFAGGSA
ncbi:hypothetical protein D3C74_262990 [compost metagenome]